MLFKYEFLKIMKRKATVIILLLSLSITTLFFSLPIIQYQTFTQEGMLSGLAGIAYNRDRRNELAGFLTETEITAFILEYQQLFENPDNVGFDGREEFLIGEAHYEFVLPRLGLLRMIMDTYSPPDVILILDHLREVDLENGAQFYETRNARIETFLQNPERRLSAGQQEFWTSKNEQVAAPLEFGYFEGWSVILSTSELLLFAILFVCIILAPVFAGEYQSGADAVILSSKYGKTKLIRAKITSAIVFGILTFTLNVIIAFAIPLLAFGTGGWNLPIQISNTIIPYSLTFLQAIFINLIVIYMVLLGMISLTLLLSAKMKIPYLVLMMIVPLFFVPIFLTPTGTTGFYNLLIYLLPYRAIMPSFGQFITYQIGGVVLDAFRTRVLLYGFGSAIMLPLAGYAFKRHQVSS